MVKNSPNLVTPRKNILISLFNGDSCVTRKYLLSAHSRVTPLGVFVTDWAFFE